MDDPVQGDQLRSIIERIEHLEEEKKTISDDIKEVYAEAKGNGYDVKVLRKVVALRKMDANERAEFEAILDLYMQAVGELADTPLGRAAAPGFSSRVTLARSAPSHSERVSRPAETARRAQPEPGTRTEGNPGARTPESEHVDRSASAPPHSAVGEPAISSTAGDAGTGPALCDEAAAAATDVQPSEAGIGSAVRAGAPIPGLAEANAIAARAVQSNPAPPRPSTYEMPDIPAFLRRAALEARVTSGEQA